MLLRAGANVNASRADTYGTTPLDCAIATHHPNPVPGHKAVAQLLMRHGGRPSRARVTPHDYHQR